MKFKFSSTILLQVTGEVDFSGDHMNVFTSEKMTLIPTFMTDMGDALQAELSEEERTAIFAIMTNNILNRAAAQTKVKDVESTGTIPTTPPPGSKIN